MGEGGGGGVSGPIWDGSVSANTGEWQMILNSLKYKDVSGYVNVRELLFFVLVTYLLELFLIFKLRTRCVQINYSTEIESSNCWMS